MPELETRNLPAELRIALGYSPAELRPLISTYFALDARLGQIVAKTSEPMLGQMRLAWWRDMLSKEASERPQGDAILDAIGAHWSGREAPLSACVDGWERMLLEPPLGEKALLEFADGRVAPMVSLVRENFGDAVLAEAKSAMRRWALTDAASKTAKGDERHLMVRMAKEEASVRYRFSRELRGIAVLDALSRRSLKRGGCPLMEGRGAALSALKAGLTGR